MRTKEEITAAIATLLDNKSKTREFNHFGKNNYENIDATIHAIREDLSYEDIEEVYSPFDEEGEYNETLGEINSSAMNGRDWLDGEVEIDEILYPEYED